jgi:hypothetical protein
MKKIVASLLLAFLIACNKTSVDASQAISIETQLLYTTEQTKAEAIIEIFNISTEISEVGIVYAQKAEPQITDNKINISKIKKGQSLTIKIENLEKGKTYYVRSYYVDANNKVIYGNTLSLNQNYDNRWSKVESPGLSGEEYILSENVTPFSRSGGIQYTRINPDNNTGTYTYFFPNFYDWDPRFINVNRESFRVRFNEINAAFVSGGQLLVLKGAGYQKLENGQRFYLKDLNILGASGYKYEPNYPGANAEISSFGQGKYVYVIENIAAGKVWRFDFEALKWEIIDTLPFVFDAKFYVYEVNQKIFVMVEPKDIKAELTGFYEYNVQNQKWAKLADFKGENRRRSTGFAYKNKIYFGAGQSSISQASLRDFWEFNPAAGSWNTTFTYPGTGTLNLASVSYEGFIFVGFGQSLVVSANKGEKFKNMKDFWRLQL